MKKLYFSPRCTVYDLHTEQSLLVGSGSLGTSQEVVDETTGGVTNEFTNKYWDSDTEWTADN